MRASIEVSDKSKIETTLPWPLPVQKSGFCQKILFGSFPGHLLTLTQPDMSTGSISALGVGGMGRAVGAHRGFYVMIMSVKILSSCFYHVSTLQRDR